MIEPFDLWAPFVTSDQGQLRLYAHTDWKHIDEIVTIIDQQNSTWVYMAVNRYLLLCNPSPNNNKNYDQAIAEYLGANLKKYTIIDYQYQKFNETGDIGNFVSPDNRFLCKKV